MQASGLLVKSSRFVHPQVAAELCGIHKMCVLDTNHTVCDSPWFQYKYTHYIHICTTWLGV